MPSRTDSMTVPLPRGWTKIVRSATLHAISVAATALTTAWGRAATGGSSRRRQRAEVDRLKTEIALLNEELELEDARWGRSAVVVAVGSRSCCCTSRTGRICRPSN